MKLFEKAKQVEKLEQDDDLLARQYVPLQSGTEVTPLQMVQLAVEKGFDLERLKTVVELERQWKADKAREAYYVALAEFKKQPLTITKDMHNKQYDSKYTSIGNLVNTVNAAMAPFGLNASWDFKQSDNGVTVTCILAHTLGHTREVSLFGPPDDSGKKNTLQQIKSTNTYLRKETFEAVTGVVTSNAEDDDGNNSQQHETLDEEQVADLEALISEVGSKKVDFLRYCKVDSLDEILAKNYKFAVEALERKRKE